MFDYCIDKIKKIFQKDVFFLGSLFLFGWLLIFPYGAHMDQEFEQRILYSNYVSYCEQLGIDGSMYQEMIQDGIINIKDSIEKDHGMAVFYPMIWIWKLNQRSSYLGNLLWHHYVYFICFLGTVSLFFLMKEMFNRNTALIITAIYFFTPRMFAEFHYNNKDLIVLSLLWIVFWRGWKLQEKINTKNIFLFAVAGALISNMKIIGLFLWGLIGIAVIAIKLMKKEFHKRIFWQILLCFAFACMFFYLSTPGAWGGIVDFLKYEIDSAQNFRWVGNVLFRGTLYTPPQNPFPRAYLPTMILYTLPAGVIVLGAFGFGSLILRFVRERDSFERIKNVYTVSIFLCGGIPVLYAVMTGPTLYNGWRHFYFVYASVMILCAQAVTTLFRERGERSGNDARDGGKKIPDMVPKALVTGYILWLILGICLNHPFEYAYYNFLVGRNAEENFELDYWDLSYKQAFDYLAKNCEGEISYGTFDDITSRMGIQIQMPVLRGKARERFVLADRWEDAEYVVVNLTYVRMYGEDDYQKLKETYDLYKVFSSYGRRVCEIYSKRHE